MPRSSRRRADPRTELPADGGGWHALSADDVLVRLDSGRDGLSEVEARARLERFGRNVLDAARPTPAWKILLDQVRSVVVLLLFLATAVALFMGDALEAAAIGAVLLLNTALGFVTELRARRAMEGLLGLEVSHASVLRKGRVREIDAPDLVPGDVIQVQAGQSVPADARLLAATDVRVDEAALTGESVPVEKQALDIMPADTGLADRTNMLYKGTAVVAGSGRAAVVATGVRTEVGRIGRLVGGLGEEKTPLEERLDLLGRRLVWLTLGVAALVTATGLVRGFDLVRMIETGIALAIAAVPEGLPAVATIALGVGLRRMARRRALIRRLPAVEALGSATVICTDKTGTLTAGQMTLTRLEVADRGYEVTGSGYAPEGEFRVDGVPIDARQDEQLSLALRIGLLANRAQIEREDGAWQARGDPTEVALVVAARKAGLDREALLQQWPEVAEVPFSSERRFMATFHRAPDGGTVALVKGAPEEVLRRSARVQSRGGEADLDDAMRDELHRRNQELASQGLRVLALATRAVDRASADELNDLVLVGLAGMMDPPAEGVAETIQRFRRAGIRTVMVTGDQKPTAQAVARDLGILEVHEEVISGEELARLADRELVERADRIGAFARVSPEDKLRIIDAFQSRGEIVAMLGDGVNDAAALKKASIGVAMGVRGTDVAKEAADVILQDDRFVTIGAAVEQGRVIYENIQKFVLYLFSCNLAEVLVLFIASLAGLPLPLLPLQILWLNLVTDTLPALALALEPAEPGVMERPPRDPQSAILSRSSLRWILVFATLIMAVSLGGFVWALGRGGPDAQAHAVTICFMTLALAQIFHLGNARSIHPVVSRTDILKNPYAVGAVLISLALQLMAVYFEPLAQVLGTRRLGLADWAVVFALGLVPAVYGQLAKLYREKR